MSAAGPDVHCWSRVAGDPVATHGRPALFLDRDGVVVTEVGYLGDPADVELIPGSAEAVAAARAGGFIPILVTNQSGVGRGYYDWAAFEAVQAEIGRRLKAGSPSAHFDAEFACGFDPSGADGVDHAWRKPAPGMLRAAQAALGVDLGASWIVGDKASDLVAGRAAGLAGGVLVATGHFGPAEQAAAEALRGDDFAVMLAADLHAALLRLLEPAGGRAPC